MVNAVSSPVHSRYQQCQRRCELYRVFSCQPEFEAIAPVKGGAICQDGINHSTVISIRHESYLHSNRVAFLITWRGTTSFINRSLLGGRFSIPFAAVSQ